MHQRSFVLHSYTPKFSSTFQSANENSSHGRLKLLHINYEPLDYISYSRRVTELPVIAIGFTFTIISKVFVSFLADIELNLTVI